MHMTLSMLSMPHMPLFLLTMILLLHTVMCCPFMLQPTILGFGHGIMVGCLHITIAKKTTLVAVRATDRQVGLRGDDPSCNASSVSSVSHKMLNSHCSDFS